MSLIPAFELGIENAWIFMIWPLLSPFVSRIIIKRDEISTKIRASVPMKHETLLNVLSMGAVILGFIYSLVLPLQFNTPWFYIGLLLFFSGLSIDVSVLYTIRKAKSDTPFVTGPYKYSRHPIYVALFLILTSIMFMSLSLIFLCIIGIVTIHMVLVAPVEEQYCMKQYGQIYQDYLKKTPRWIGIPKSQRKK